MYTARLSQLFLVPEQPWTQELSRVATNETRCRFASYSEPRGRNRQRRRNLRVAWCVWLLLLARIALAQDSSTFHADVALVHVDAEVRSTEGRVLTGFAKNDFRVFDNDLEQVITAFSAEEQPLDVILLFDISGSMRSRIKKVAVAAHQGLCELQKGDRVAVIVFNTDTRLMSYLTDDMNAIERSIQSVLDLRFGGGTAIQDAVESAVDLFQHGEIRKDRRRAVLVITDNNGRPNHHQTAITEKYWESDAILCGLITGHHKSLADLLHSSLPSLYGGIDDIVEKTGGDLIPSEDLATQLPEMMHRLRSRYSLYYRLPEGVPNVTRTIRVELTPEAQKRYQGARVAARTGYRLGTRQEDGFTRR